MLLGKSAVYGCAVCVLLIIRADRAKNIISDYVEEKQRITQIFSILITYVI